MQSIRKRKQGIGMIRLFIGSLFVLIFLSAQVGFPQGTGSPPDEGRGVGRLYVDANQWGSADLAEFVTEDQSWQPSIEGDNHQNGAAGRHVFRLEKGVEHTLTVYPIEAINPDDGAVSLWWRLWGAEDRVWIDGELATAASPVTGGSGDIDVLDYTVCIGDKTDGLKIQAMKKLAPGEQSQAFAPNAPSNVDITWSIVRREPDDDSVAASIDPASGVITVSERSGSGTITIRAEYEGVCCGSVCKVADEAKIEISGCGSCSAGVCPVPGSGSPTLGSVDMVWSLGTLSTGKSAGQLFLHADEMSPKLATPAALWFDGISDEVEVIKGAYCELRQIFAPQTFADIVVLDDFSYEVRFYTHDNVGGKNALGLYELTGKPFVTWQVLNTSGSTVISTGLQLTKIIGTEKTIISYYSWPPDNWSLGTNSALRREFLEKIQLSETSHREIRWIEDGSKTMTTYTNFAWGDEITEEIVVAEDGNLTTTSTYYTDETAPGYGNVHTISRPDGSQVEYEYDVQGRMVVRYDTWNDTQKGKVTLYDYTPVDAGDNGSIRPRSPRTVTEQVNGVTIRKTYYAYIGNTEIAEQVATADASYGAAGNQRRSTTYYSANAPKAAADKVQQIINADGTSTHYSYEQGNLSGSGSNPDSYVFTPGAGKARREIVTYGPATANRTTRDVALYNDRGDAVLNETQVFTGSGYERIAYAMYETNDFGQITKSTYHDGTIAEADWGCCGKSWERDRQGIERLFSYDALNRLKQTTKTVTPDISTYMVYELAGRRQIEYISAGSFWQRASVNIYDRAGRPKQQTDAANLTTTYAYADGGLTTTITHPGNLVEITEHYLDGRVKRVSGSGVVERNYVYGVNADGSQWTTVYTGQGVANFLTTTTNLLGQTIREERPGYGDVTLTTTMTYNAHGQLTRVETPGQAATLYGYDALGQQTRSGLDITGDGVLNAGDRISVAATRYAKDGGVWWQITESGLEGETTLSKSRLTGLGAPSAEGVLTGDTVTMDADGRQTVSRSYTDQATRTVTRISDLPETTQDAVNISVNGLLTHTTTASGLTYAYGYDALERRTSVTDPRTGASLTHYNEKGQVDYTQDAAGHQTRYTYDPDTGRRATVTDANGAVTSYGYDGNGRLNRVTGPSGTTTVTYDAIGRKIQVDDPSGSVRFEYDQAMKEALIALVDQNGQRTTFDYFPDGRLKTTRRPMLQETSYEYDTVGRLWTITDAKHQITEYGYDNEHVRTITYSDGHSVTLNYDGHGHLAGYDDGETSATYVFDMSGRKTKETVNFGPFTKDVAYTYADRGMKETVTTPDGTVSTYHYGNANELQQIEIPGVGAISMPAYELAQPTRVLLPNGLQREISYDAARRMQAFVVSDAGGNPLLNSVYTYNSAGNITAKQTEHGNYIYGYDAASRLISAEHPTIPAETYAYDAVGNRTTASNATGAIEHNLNNELVTYGDIQYTYDLNGNLTQKRVGTAAVNYTYNVENRLIKVEDDLTNAVIAEYGYDPFGRRLWKEVQGVRTYFLYSDEGLLAEYDATGTELRSYGWQPDFMWSTNPLWLKENGQYYFYQNDHLGTPQKLVAMNGSVVWSAQYEAFGNAHIDVETVVNNLRFPGQYFDKETGLHYNFQRYYDPAVGRYISADPIGFDGDDVNWYGYVGNDPINKSDPIGLKVRFAINNCEMTATVNIGIYADKDTQIWFNQDHTRWDDVANMIRRATEVWNEKAWVFDGCSLKFVINVSIDRESTTFWTVNADNKIKITHEHGASVNGWTMSLGEWGRREDEHTYAHEIGHLMNLVDRYHAEREGYYRVDVPDEGYEWSIMANHTNSVKFADIVEMMKVNHISCPCECRCFPWPRCDKKP